MRVAINWYGQQPPTVDANTYSGTVTVTASGGTPVHVNVNLQVLGPADLPAAIEAMPTALTNRGCVDSDPQLSYTFAVRCAIPNEAPIADPALTQPAVGNSFIDPVFGGKITRITSPGCFTEYGTTTAFSANSTYVLTSCGVYRTIDAKKIRGVNPHGSIDYSLMSATDDEVYYFMTGSQIRKYNFVTDQETVLGDFSVAPYNFHTLYAGGTTGASEDDWMAFYDYNFGATPKICATNLPALAAAGRPNSSNTYCTTYHGIRPMQAIDWASATEVDSVTNKRYIYVSANPLSIVFSVGSAASGLLQQEYVTPEQPGWGHNNDDGVCSATETCIDADNFTHVAIFKDRDGQIKIFGHYYDGISNRYYNSTFRLSAGLNLFRPQEDGGGLTILGRFDWDIQPGCSSRISACVAASIETGTRYAARVTTAGTATGSTLLTLSLPIPGSWASHSLHPVRVMNATGSWSCLNGAWTATALPSNQVAIPASCVGAAGSIGRVMLGDASQPYTGSANDNRNVIQIWYPERSTHSVAHHRAAVWNDVPGTGINAYYDTVRASISRDGRYVAFNSSWGALDFDGASVYIAETGASTQNKITLKSVRVAAKGASISYDVSGAGACTFQVSDDPGFQHMVETFGDPAGPISRLTSVGRFTPLAPATNYWMRIQCGMEVESRMFRTLSSTGPSSSALNTGVGPTNDPMIAKAVIQYRNAGDAQFLSTPAVPCASGCRIPWQGVSGSVSEYRVIYQDAGGNPRVTGDTATVAIP